MESLDSRKLRFNLWLSEECGLSSPVVNQLPGDASFRRYYRVSSLDRTFIAMDAPPPETCESFVAISKTLARTGLRTPEVYVADLQHGFLLLTDFGDETLLRILNTNNANQLYRRALTALATLQSCREVPGREMAPFDADFIWKEWAWHQEWFTEKWLGVSLSANDKKQLDDCYQLLVANAVNQPQVFMHRDYHSANLMHLSTGEIGILDFQDAFIGPVTYDVASLLRDCYISWPQEKVIQWLYFYYDLLQEQSVIAVSRDEFTQWFDWMGVQRQLKALLTFARKHVRDQQSHYLQHVPRTLDNLLFVCQQYPELAPLHHYLQECIPTTAKVSALCAQ